MFGKWQEEFGNPKRECSKVSKVVLWRDPFIQSKKFMSLKSSEELCAMTMKNGAKFGKGWVIISKLILGNLRSFDSSTQKCQKIVLYWDFLNKIYNVWAKKVQRSYVW